MLVLKAGVRATCNLCGDISLTIDDVTLRVLVGQEGAPYGHQYRFRCSLCGGINVKGTSLYVVNLLLSAGVKRETWQLPLEMLERPKDDAPGLSLDDVIDLHLELEDEEAWINRMKDDG